MENSGKYGASHIVLAVLGGAVAGATVALLFAPKTGKETRQQLGGYVNTTKEKVSRVPEALAAAGNAVVETMAAESAEISKELTVKRHGHA